MYVLKVNRKMEKDLGQITDLELIIIETNELVKIEKKFLIRKLKSIKNKAEI